MIPTMRRSQVVAAHSESCKARKARARCERLCMCYRFAGGVERGEV